MKFDNTALEEILLKTKYLSSSELSDIKTKLGKESLFDYLVSNNILPKELLGQSIAEYNKLKYYDIQSKTIGKFSFSQEVADYMYKNMLLAIADNTTTVTFTTFAPENIKEYQANLQKFFPKKSVNFSFSFQEDIESIYAKYKRQIATKFSEIKETEYFATPEAFQQILEEAADLRASDIHFEPQNNKKVTIRYRIDGQLTIVAEIPEFIYLKILNRIKVLSHLRIDEHFEPQDGSIRINTGKYEIDLRISIAPTIDGEKTAIRLLTNYIRHLALEDLGFSGYSMEILQNTLKKRYGMILTTGPTGSGKTTTLYSVIKLLKDPSVNITTIEDPVEYRIPGVNQIQVSEDHNITFAKGLRSIVRQDPNIILVGEIRDNDTADIAVNAALTGHLLLSTFHANDAASAIPRLIDMGIEPFLLSSTINLVIAQRLIRKICPVCKRSIEYSQTDLKKLLPTPKKYFKSSTVRLYTGKGCDNCDHTGYQGRMAIFELMYVTDEMRSVIEKSPSSLQIWTMARENGAKSFFEDGLEKVILGQTTLEELIRVAPIL